MNDFQAITLGIAMVGAVPGVINTWHNLSKDDVRLKIVPAHALPVVGGRTHDWTLSIGVINPSTFPVMIDEIGLQLGGSKERVVIMHPRLTSGQSLPQRLEPRESLTVLCDSEVRSHPRLAGVRSAYVRCQCGTVRYGTSPALRQFIRDARATHDA